MLITLFPENIKSCCMVDSLNLTNYCYTLKVSAGSSGIHILKPLKLYETKAPYPLGDSCPRRSVFDRSPIGMVH